jgi:hypothetical protein
MLTPYGVMQKQAEKASFGFPFFKYFSARSAVFSALP